jgi:hypothetical protein
MSSGVGGRATKRKRVKLKCLVCSREFDSDYRVVHNNKYHPEYRNQNKLVPYEAVGAQKNPFEGAKRKQRFQEGLEKRIDTDDTNITEVF